MVNKAGWGTTAPKSVEYPARFSFSPSAFLERRIYPAKYTFHCERFNLETGEELTPEESSHFHKEYKRL